MSKKILKSLFIIQLLCANICYANDMVAVLGYQNATNDELWQQQKIGFGIKSLLQQALLDKNFSLLDEKIVLGMDNQKLTEEQLKNNWTYNENQTTPESLNALAKKHNLNHIFWVKITEFDEGKNSLSLGPFHRKEFNKTLTLEVCRYSLLSNNTECREGEATESRTLTSTGYEASDKVSFKDTGAGQMSQDAINQALTELLHHE
ncbi:MAG: hypothetical protein RIQ94_2959 [Pseudomonadota bacterium]